MGIFDFLKKISGEKKEKHKAKAVNLEKAEELIDSFSEKLAKDANSKLKEIKEKIAQEKIEMEENIKLLEEAEARNKAFPERAMHMMEGNRKIYVQKTKALLNSINLPDEFDEILKFCNCFDYALDDFGRSTMRNYHILLQFFGEKVSSISKNIVGINASVKQAEKLLKNSGIERVNELKNKIKDVKEKVKRKESLKEKIMLEEKELEKTEKKIAENENKTREKEGSDKYRQFTELVDEKKNIEKELTELEKEPFHHFSVINDALKKYERMTTDDKLVRSYLADPLKALEEDKELKIIEVISKMKDSIAKGKLELKKEKKDRIMQECDNINKTEIKAFLAKNAELNKRFSELDSKIADETIIKEIEELKKELKHEKNNADENKNRIGKLAKESESISIENLKKELESDINEALSEKVKIA